MLYHIKVLYLKSNIIPFKLYTNLIDQDIVSDMEIKDNLSDDII